MKNRENKRGDLRLLCKTVSSTVLLVYCVGVVEYLKVAVILSSALKLQNPDYVMLIFSAI